MTFDEFIAIRDIKIKDAAHKKIVRLFYPYLRSVSGDEHLLPAILEKIIGLDLSDTAVVTACFNGVNDNTSPPYNNVDLYIKLNGDIKVFVYGRNMADTVKLKENEYAVFVLADEITDNIDRTRKQHIFLK